LKPSFQGKRRERKFLVRGVIRGKESPEERGLSQGPLWGKKKGEDGGTARKRGFPKTVCTQQGKYRNFIGEDREGRTGRR